MGLPARARTNNISCWGSCDNSVSDGTCDLWSLGCCDS
jgi:hypothetical protein